jgi:hypothetical protein
MLHATVESYDVRIWLNHGQSGRDKIVIGHL